MADQMKTDGDSPQKDAADFRSLAEVKVGRRADTKTRANPFAVLQSGTAGQGSPEAETATQDAGRSADVDRQ
jgi:hypothetical protein